MKWLLLLLILSAGTGFAQTKSRPVRKKLPERAPAPAAVAPDKWPIKQLRVEGNHVFTSDRILAVTGLKIGQMAGKPEFEAAHDRLLETGAFETVGYKFAAGPAGEGYVATFTVTEADTLPVRFEDLGAADAELDKLLRSKDPLFSADHVPSTRSVIDRYTDWISEFLAAKDLDAKITGYVTPWPEKLAIVFRPSKSLSPVAEVAFEGEQTVTESALREAVSGPAVGAPFTEDRFREILDHSVRPLYEAKGRIRVAFSKIRTEPAEDVQGLRVFVTVNEGEVYKLGKVSISGASPIRPEELLKAGEFKTGETADFDRIREGMERIRQALRRAGYLDAEITPERDIHDAEKTVDMTAKVEPGARYLMGRLTIAGLDLDGEAEMKRIWTMKPGNPFNPEYPDHFLSQVRERGLFDNLGKTTAQITPDERAHTADVTLTFGGEAPKPAGPGGRRPGR